MSPSLIEVSIIIPCLNEERHISACLDSIFAGNFPKEKLEVLVVDGGSTDGTLAILDEYITNSRNVRLLHNPKVIPPSAVNIGIQNARGEIIVRVDAHSIYPEGYVSDCVALLRRTGAGNAGGRIVTIPNGDTPWAVAVSIVTASRFGVGGGVFRTGGEPGFVDTVPFGTFPKSVFDKIGYFDDRLTRTEDIEFNGRLRQAGYTIAFDPKIAVKYKNQATLTGLMRQGFYNGMWIIYALYLYSHSFHWRRFIPLGFAVYLFLFPVFLSATGSFLPALASLPLIAYLTMNVVCSTRSSGGLASRLRVFTAYAGYHLSYGSGSIWGILNLITGCWKRYLGKSVKR